MTILALISRWLLAGGWKWIAGGIGAAVLWFFVLAPIWHQYQAGATVPALNQEIADLEAQAEFVAKQNAITTDVATTAQKHQEQIRTVTNTIIKEVPVYVPASVDAVLPNGFVRLHDDAATSESTLPNPTGKPDAAPSDVRLSQAGTVLAQNYGSCNATRQQLLDLQDWIKKEAALAATKP